eukprot:jgi/Ulvmu1/9827/UM056_0068.1
MENNHVAQLAAEQGATHARLVAAAALAATQAAGTAGRTLSLEEMLGSLPTVSSGRPLSLPHGGLFTTLQSPAHTPPMARAIESVYPATAPYSSPASGLRPGSSTASSVASLGGSPSQRLPPNMTTRPSSRGSRRVTGAPPNATVRPGRSSGQARSASTARSLPYAASLHNSSNGSMRHPAHQTSAAPGSMTIQEYYL